MQRSLFTDPFFLIFSFDLSFDLDCTLTGQGGFKTDFGVRESVREESLHSHLPSFFIFSAAASGHACKSVLNPYVNQKTKVKKIRQRLRVHRCDP